jgi:thymidylate synthase (FAD)
MQIIKPQVEFVWHTPDAMHIIEEIGRTAYKSEDKMQCNECGYGNPNSDLPDGYQKLCEACKTRANKFISMIIKRGHESVLEHASASIRFICDRGVTHEIVRHRLASYTQESTRYCDYSPKGGKDGIQVIRPTGLTFEQQIIWDDAMLAAEYAYNMLRKLDVPPQIARSVLPTGLKTEIVMTANFREWRHFFKLRCAPAAHPQMQEVANMAYNILNGMFPVIFSLEGN